jgi:hypothetical protein
MTLTDEINELEVSWVAGQILSPPVFWRRGFNTPTVRHSNALNGLDEPTVGVAERKP